jgi:glycerol uptake facilitator-like aquaporin
MPGTGVDSVVRCFVERDARLAIYRRATCEAVGTLLLMFAASGSSLMVQRIGPTPSLLALVAGAASTACALVGMIFAFGEAPGGHFNPLISAAQWLNGERSRGTCTRTNNLGSDI